MRSIYVYMGNLFVAVGNAEMNYETASYKTDVGINYCLCCRWQQYSDVDDRLENVTKVLQSRISLRFSPWTVAMYMNFK
jgi:hypothetical protein